MQLSNALQGIISQDLLPAADRTRRVLAYELVVANGAVRNLIRENQLHQLENMIQTGRKEGMVLMDNCLYDLYCKCAITYDTAISRAYHLTASFGKSPKLFEFLQIHHAADSDPERRTLEQIMERSPDLTRKPKLNHGPQKARGLQASSLRKSFPDLLGEY